MFMRAFIASVLLLVLALPGCKTAEPEKQPELKGLPRAQAFFDQGKYQDAMIECVDLARKAPDTPGLADLQNKIVQHITEERTRVAAMRAKNTHAQMSAEVEANNALPDTYGMRRNIRGNSTSLRTPPTSMELAMQKKVTINLDNVNLNDFIMQIGNSEGVNIISDNINNAKTMTVHADNVPLQEILDYISRNLGISFYVGDNVIWATPRDQSQPIMPLETRLYRLRKGVSGDELGGTGGSESNNTMKASGSESNATINIVKAIERFVPKPPGADLLFDKKTHVLIVKNNRENLAKAEEIIESLDVCPPQVLIEARFITTEITDLRELGVDWILNSAITVSKQNVLNNGVAMNSPQTQIASGSSVGFTPFQNTANGMNLTYQGLLTDPMFQAVLHALETSGKSRTLSVPRVTTVNNRAATIRIGQDYRYFDQYGTQTYSSSGSSMGLNTIVNETTVVVPVGKPEIEELGIELNVIPSVGADLQTVTLQMAPSIKGTAPEAQWFSYSMPEQLANGAITNVLITLPVFTVSEMKTEVNVQSGETVVMGGLISSTESKSVERVPILSSIPFIGKLFQHDTTSEDKENLLIFVTATILSDRGESLIPINEVPEEQANPMEKAAGN